MKKEPMFCLETAVKLLTFSWVVYSDTTPPAAEKEVHIDISSSKVSVKGDMAVQPDEAKSSQQVSAGFATLQSNPWFSIIRCSLQKLSILFCCMWQERLFFLCRLTQARMT